MKNFLISCVGLLSCLSAFSQTTSRVGLNYGIHIGWQLVGNAEAEMYDCRGGNNGADLEQILINNTYNYTQLQDYYNDDFTLYEYPNNITYKPALSLGGTLQYYLTESFAVVFNIVYLSPSIHHSNFSIKLSSPGDNLTNEVIEQGTVSAKESRFNIDLGVHKAFTTGTYKPFVECAVVGSFLETKSHEISIGNITQSVLSYSNTDANTSFSKFGYGASCTFGLQFPLKERFYIYSGISLATLHYGIVDTPYSLAKGIDVKILF